MGDFKMPSLGADMDAGKVARWLVKPGDVVHRGDIVAVVETEKSTIEVEVFQAGVVEEILVPEGTEVPVGTALARIGAPAEAGAPAPGPVPPAAAVPAPAAPAPPAPVPAPATAAVTEHPGVVVSPVVRHLAERLGVDVHLLEGSGPGGRITRADVEAAALVPAGERPVSAVHGRRAPARRRRPAPQPAPSGAGGKRVSPWARRVADDLGVDVATVEGTGPGGAVVERDVRAAAARETAPPAPEGAKVHRAPTEPSASDERQAAMRKAIGALMARSKREIPHYYLSTTIDMSRASRWMEEENATRPMTERLVLPVLLLKAAALAVASVPEMNGFMVGDTFEPSAEVHVGVAVSLRTGGVIAPAIHHADRLSVDELMAALRDLVTRARRGVLRSSEMSDPTITVTNLGELGVDSVFGVIYPPQVALVGFGRVVERPYAEDGMVGARPCLTATLSADHRASDGHRGGRFLAAIDHLLQSPEGL